MSQAAAVARPLLSWRDVAFMVGGALLLAASSYVEVPFYPVPMTLQTLVVLALGLFGGFKRGTGAVAAFLAAGAMGAPVFAGGAAGPLVLMGPTGGYLIGFLAAAAICGLAKDRGWTRTILASVLVALVADAAIFGLGLAQLGQFMGYGEAVLAAGLYPFVLGDLVKVLIAALGSVAFARSFKV